ncbi:dTMP kinase [Atopobiaceae bacterium 24-176]
MARGTFISLEGIDGSGKTTQAARLAEALELSGREVVRLREPGGTQISEKVRSLLLDPANGAMTASCELLLYEASRAQLVGETIAPALARGAWVVCDRFADSTTAYQRAGRGLASSMVEEANALACGDCVPDATLWLDVEPARGLGRALAEGAADRIEAEGLAFQERVREGYDDVWRRHPDRVARVDASGGPDEVWARIVAALAERGVHV